MVFILPTVPDPSQSDTAAYKGKDTIKGPLHECGEYKVCCGTHCCQMHMPSSKTVGKSTLRKAQSLGKKAEPCCLPFHGKGFVNLWQWGMNGKRQLEGTCNRHEGGRSFICFSACSYDTHVLNRFDQVSWTGFLMF